MKLVRRILALAAIAVVPLTHADAQTSEEVVVESVDGNWPAGPIESVFVPGVDHSTAVRMPRFETYFKMGPSFLMGDGFFANDSNVGYQITGGIREPLLPGLTHVFFDVGGEYMQASGDDTRVGNVVVTADSIIPVFSAADDPDQDNRAVVNPVTRLEDMRRGSIHAAVGWRTVYTNSTSCLAMGAVRIGGRVGHVRGSFERDQDAIDDVNRLIGVADNSGVDSFVSGVISETDTFTGLFMGWETTLARQVTRSADVAFVIDAEISNDWIDFKNFEDHGLVTASVLFGLSVSR